MKKKLLITSLISIMLIVTLLAGCAPATESASPAPESEAPATESEAPATESEAPAEGEKLRVAMCMSHQTNDFVRTITEGAIAKGEELGIEVVVFDGNNDSATQITQIESAVDQGYNGIMFEPINVDAVTQVVQYANENNVPIINIVGAMTDWEQYVAGYSGGDNVTAGQLEMEKVAELIGGEGNIAIINGPMGSDPQIQRRAGYDLVLAEYPNIEVVFEDDAGWATDAALTITENWLQSGTELKAIVCQNDGMAVGAGKAVQDAGVEGIIVTGVDATADGIDAIKSGMITGTVSQDPAAQGANGTEMLYKVIMGETVENNDIRTENIWIDASNVE